VTEQQKMTQKQFADHLGVRPSYVTKLKQAGRLVLEGKKVLVPQSLELIEKTKDQNRDDVSRRHALNRNKGDGEQRANKKKSKKESISIESFQNARARKMRADADQEEMNRDKLAGLLIAKEDSDFVIDDFGALFRLQMENMPDRLAPITFSCKTMEEHHAAISEYAEQMQREMAETMRKRSGEFNKK